MTRPLQLRLSLTASNTSKNRAAPEFTELKRTILARIRETSGMQTDLDQLAKLTAVG